jgi:uncharacterized membrane protein
MSSSHPPAHSGASKRMEALSDGIFAIAATLLVLDIRIPEIIDASTPQMMHSMYEILPSLLAFIFSFLNILIFWVNHDSIGKVINYYDATLTYLNILFLLFISLVPFTTAFVSRYPFQLISISVYGLVSLLTASVAAWMYYHVAFKSNLMHKDISQKLRMKIWKRILLGPLFFSLAIACGWIHVFIPIIIYVLVPLLFLVMPKIEFQEK